MSRQKLGQHFLSSSKVLAKIADAARGSSHRRAVEIGPGKGALTELLLERFERVNAIELDPALAEHVRQRWLHEPRFTVVERDALHVAWSTWGPGVLVGNLPYYVASAIISRYVREPGFLTPGIFLIQKEVAERIAATPGHREYGYFSVECQLLAKVDSLFDVPPGAFRPPPRVESAVVRLTPFAPPAGLDVHAFLRFVSACFRHKRKTLRNNLSGLYVREALQDRPEIGQRAEQLSVDQFLTLYRAFDGAPEGSSNEHEIR